MRWRCSQPLLAKKLVLETNTFTVVDMWVLLLIASLPRFDYQVVGICMVARSLEPNLYHMTGILLVSSEIQVLPLVHKCLSMFQCGLWYNTQLKS